MSDQLRPQPLTGLNYSDMSDQSPPETAYRRQLLRHVRPVAAETAPHTGVNYSDMSEKSNVGAAVDHSDA